MHPVIGTKRLRLSSSITFRYGLAFVSIGSALAVAYIFLRFHWPQPFAGFALSAIAITFWYGGTRPGIVSTILAMLVRNFFFDPGTNTQSRVLFELTFLVFAWLMMQVARSRDELEVRVSERTADLTWTNRELTLQIADRKQAEYLTEQVFECFPDGIAIVGRDYRYQRVNPAYGRFWGISADNIVGAHVGDVLTMDFFESKLKGNYDRCFAGEEVHYNDWLTGHNGDQRYLAITYSPLRPHAQEVEAALVIGRDLTEQIRAVEKLRQTQADLAHVNRVTTMGELTASLAHEVNQPITAAVTNARTCVRWLTRDQPDIEEARAAAMRIVQDGTRAAAIINRIRMLFKKETPERVAVDVNEIVREMVILLRAEATRHGILIQTHLADNLPNVMADPVQLQQVLLNLIVNGIDAVKDVYETRELTITSKQGNGGGVMVTVADTGVGVPAQPDHIFNAFYTTKPHGTGMGLSISRSIIESHGGKLWASHNSPNGAAFHLTLPPNPE